MSTINRPERRASPPLVEGQRLDRAAFHARYSAMPDDIRAELVGGIVYLGSRVPYEHGRRQAKIAYWFGHYKRFTRGVCCTLNATTQFDDYGEVQPDCQLRIPEELGGRSRIVGGYIVGPPELVVEVSQSSRRLDLGPKKADYERAGVLEYIVIGVDPDEVHWFVLRGGLYAEKAPDANGLYRSEVFPGLWLDPAALLAGDFDGVIAALERGLAAPEHAAFVARLAGGGTKR